MIACVRRETQTLCRGWWGAKVRISPNKEHSLVKTQVAGLWCLRVTTAFRFKLYVRTVLYSLTRL